MLVLFLLPSKLNCGIYFISTSQIHLKKNKKNKTKELQCNTDNRTNTKRKSTHKSRVFQDDFFYELQEAQLRYNEDDQCAQSNFRLQNVDRRNKGFLENALRPTWYSYQRLSILAA